MLVGRTAFSMSSRLQTPAALRESELPAYIEDTSESVGAIPTPLVGYPMRSPEPEETANDTSGVTLEHPLPKASIRPYKTLPPMPIATVEDALVEQSSLFQHASQEKRPHTLLGFARSLDTLLLAGFSLLSLALGLALVSRSLRAHREEKQDKESQKGAQPNSGDPQEAEPISKWTINAAVCNHKGNIRHNNEDNFYLNGRFMVLGEMDDGCLAETVSDATLQTYSVCDGMGGEAAGEEASCYAVKALDSLMHESGDSLSNDQICKATNQISKDIYQGAKSKGCRSGATLAMCIWQGESMRVAHIGDSRVYMLRGGTLRQLTSDHSEAQRMINLGIITPQEALTHPKRHVINQYLGMPADEVTVVPTITAPLKFWKTTFSCFAATDLPIWWTTRAYKRFWEREIHLSKLCRSLCSRRLQMADVTMSLHCACFCTSRADQED